ncbi:MAG: Fe-S cluster assembly protein SufD [Kiritimatiellaceae bacterium]|nr:Fe-S cluster assembly protein SufD [Kiritimatiellaceae bacterium]
MTGSSTQTTDPTLEMFAELLPGALEDSADPAAQKAALDDFLAYGLPHRKLEAWKYTNITKAVQGPFTRPHSGAWALKFPDEVKLKMITTFPVIGKDQPFALLSRALTHGGIELTVPPNTVVKDLVEIGLPVAKANTLFCPTLVIRVGAGSKVDFVVRSGEQGEGSLVSLIAEMDVGENASASLTKIRTGSGAHFTHMQTRQAAGSHLELFDFTRGGTLTRNDLNARVDGEGAEVDVHGLYVLNGTSHADHHTAVEHAVPNTVSRQLYKGIVNERACGVFNGRIIVDPGASGTDALQMNRNLLGGKGRVDTKPQLEIANDDVRCAHGATIGRLDETQLFYLQSRGLDPVAAEAILARGFAGEALDCIRNPAVRAEIDLLAEAFFGGIKP